MTGIQPALNPLDGLRYQAAASLSPDAERVAVTVAWRGEEHERRVVRIVEVATGSITATIDGSGRDGAPAWSPDGSSLALVSDRQSGVPQLYRADPDGGQLRRLTNEERGVIGAPIWSPDGRRIALAAYAGPSPHPSAPRRIVRAAWRADGIGLVEDNLTQVLVVSVDDADHPERLTDASAVAQPLAWARDGRRLLLSVAFRPEAAAGDPSEGLVEATLDGDVRWLPVPRGLGTLAAYLDDGSIVFVHHVRSDLPWGTGSRLWRLDPDGSVAPLAPGSELDILGDADTNAVGDFLTRPSILLCDGTSVVTRAQSGASLGIYRISAGARVTEIAVSPTRCHHPLELRGNHLLHAATSLDEPVTLALTDLRSGLTVPVEGRWEDERPELGRLRVHRGTEPCAWWFVPPSAARAAPHPTVLIVHGGPFSAIGETFFPTVHLLTGAGFGVVMANPSGSRGYGDEFGRAVHGDWGGADADELLAVIDRVIEAGLADAGRLGITGASYGGYMSCLLAARTRRFAAAVADVPVTDLLSERGTSDLGPTLLAGYFGDDHDAMRRSSPITYAAGCVTPTLLLLGLEDHRCPPTQGIEFYTALGEAGCPAEMLLLPGASHWGSVNGPLAGRRAQEAALVQWFDRHLDTRPESDQR